MRILFTFEFTFEARHYGGGHQIARGLARALVRAGHEVHVLASGTDILSVAKQDAPVHWHFTARYNRRWAGVQIARAAVQLLGELRPDLLCAYTSEAPFLQRTARRLGVPTTVYLAAPQLLPFRARRLSTLRLIRYNLLTWLQSLAAVRVPLVLTISKMISAQAVERWGVRPDRVVTVGTGIDEAYAASHAAPRPTPGQDGPRLLSFGRIMLSQKPLDAVAAALALPGSPWREWTIVGGGPDADRMHKTVSALGLADRVRFLDMRSPEEVMRLVDTHDIVLLPSRSESFFITAYEAAARGRLLITNDVAEVGCYFHDAPSVAILPNCDPEGYRRALDEMCRDFETRQLAAVALARRVCQDFGWDTVARSFLDGTRELTKRATVRNDALERTL